MKISEGGEFFVPVEDHLYRNMRIMARSASDNMVSFSSIASFFFVLLFLYFVFVLGKPKCVQLLIITGVLE